MNKSRGLYIILFVLLLCLLGLGGHYLLSKGVIFQREERIVKEEQEEKGLKITEPEANSEIGCTFTISGKASKEWFFENSFPYVIFVEGKEVLSGEIYSDYDDTEKEMISFSQKIDCKEGCLGSGEILLKNANPSGLEEYAKEERIPVRFISSCAVPDIVKESTE